MRDDKIFLSIPEEWRDVPVGTKCILTWKVEPDIEQKLQAAYLGIEITATRVLAKVITYGNLRIVEFSRLSFYKPWSPKIGDWVAFTIKTTANERAIAFASFDQYLTDTSLFEVFRIPESIPYDGTKVGWWREFGEKYEG